MSERIQAGLFEAGGIAFTVETNRPGFAARVGNVFRDLAVTDGGSGPVIGSTCTAPPSFATVRPWSWRVEATPGRARWRVG
jgi:hypothetical protein